jgi:hypothetical protein
VVEVQTLLELGVQEEHQVVRVTHLLQIRLKEIMQETVEVVELVELVAINQVHLKVELVVLVHLT